MDQLAGIDSSLNGVQAGNLDADIEKIGFAVDACIDTFERALREGADLVFVHHGLFWGPAAPLTGVLGDRVRFLMTHDIALYAAHLPLDQHPEWGNNALIADALELTDIEPFGEYKREKIGYKGRLKEPLPLGGIVEKLFGSWDARVQVLPFGSESNETVAVISGGGAREVSDAIRENLDCYITGESSHSVFHECKEAGINVVFGGHYLTEIYGVKALAELIHKELGVETFFIDVPTGY